MEATGVKVDWDRIREARELKSRRKEIAEKVWLALRGCSMGAHLDIEYARELSEEFRAVFIDNDD